jgi:hypothetical protein
MDYLHDESVLEKLLTTRKYNIVANQQISLDLLNKNRARIGFLNYELREDMDFSYCKKLKSCGIKVIFFTRHEGEKLNDVRFRMLDISLVESIKPTELTESPEKILDKNETKGSLRFKTNKYLLSDGRIYLSHAHCLSGIGTPNFTMNDAEVIDNSDFWKDSSYFYLYSVKTT